MQPASNSRKDKYHYYGSVRGRLRAWERRDCFIALYMKDDKRGERCVAIFDNPLQLLQWRYGSSEPTPTQIHRMETTLAIARHYQLTGHGYVSHYYNKKGESVRYEHKNGLARRGKRYAIYIIPNEEDGTI